MSRRRLLFTKQNKRKRTEENEETRVEAFGEEEPAEWPFSW